MRCIFSSADLSWKPGNLDKWRFLDHLYLRATINPGCIQLLYGSPREEMRQKDINKLNAPYPSPRDELDRRFDSSIGASVASAGGLFQEIFNDLDTMNYGISWWGTVPAEERILISDYLYQCADGIEKNLVEAKLHYVGVD